MFKNDNSICGELWEKLKLSDIVFICRYLSGLNTSGFSKCSGLCITFEKKIKFVYFLNFGCRASLDCPPPSLPPVTWILIWFVFTKQLQLPLQLYRLKQGVKRNSKGQIFRKINSFWEILNKMSQKGGGAKDRRPPPFYAYGPRNRWFKIKG